jgi:5-methylcytosine-specific restriction endonuclease McrA
MLCSKSRRVLRVTRKYRIIQEAGGSCCICGYNKNISSLAFHHVHEKQNKLSGHALVNRKFARVQEEANKCVLVCHNCHGEIHNPELTMTNMAKLSELLNSKKFTLRELFNYFFPEVKKKK